MISKRDKIMIGLRAGIRAFNPAYVLGDPVEYESGVRLSDDQPWSDNFVTAFLTDVKSGERIPLAWTEKDEEAQDLVPFIRSMSENAVQSLSDVIEMKTTGTLKV